MWKCALLQKTLEIDWKLYLRAPFALLTPFLGHVNAQRVDEAVKVSSMNENNLNHMLQQEQEVTCDHEIVAKVRH